MMPVRLTARGRGAAIVGAALVVAGIVMGSGAVLAAGVFALALTAAAVGFALLSRPRAAIRRSAVPPSAAAGGRITTTAEVVAARGTPAAVVSGLAPAWGQPADRDPVVVLPPLNRPRSISKTFACPTRGRYSWGTIRLEVPDPLGLAYAPITAAEDRWTVVFPATVALPGIPGAGSGGGTGDDRPNRSVQHHAAGTAGDPVPRLYQPSDELRRMHWPATARTGQPMVRTEDDDRGRRLVLALDCTPAGYRDAAAFERAVTAAASVAVAFLAADWMVSLRTTSGGVLTGRSWVEGAAGRVDLLTALAQVAPGDTGGALPGQDPSSLRWVVCGAATAAHMAQRGGPGLTLSTEHPLGDRAATTGGVRTWDGTTSLTQVLGAADQLPAGVR